jgi:hypothetical protein
MENIIISQVTGLTPPYEIYICDYLGITCEFMETVTDTISPIKVYPIPSVFSGAPALTVKIIQTTTNCEKTQNVVCSYFGNVFHTFCNCSDNSICHYIENNPNLSIGESVTFSELEQCWVYSGYQFTFNTSEELTIENEYGNCQECFNNNSPTYFSACCYDYTFKFNNEFQSGFTPNISWYVNIPPSGLGDGTGYTGCTIVISNYETPTHNYDQTDWNDLTNTEYSTLYPFPIMKSCDDCTEINTC